MELAARSGKVFRDRQPPRLARRQAIRAAVNDSSPSIVLWWILPRPVLVRVVALLMA